MPYEGKETKDNRTPASMERRGAVPQYRWVVLFASFYAFVTYAFALQLVPPLMGPIIHEFNVSHAQAGLLMSMVVIPGIFLSIPAGILVDRRGVRLAGSVSTALIALGSAVTAIADSFGLMLTGRLILGVGGSFIATATPAIIPQWFSRDELGKAMGIYGINMPVGSSIALPLASALTLVYGWRFPFYISTASAILGVLVFAVLVKEGPLKHERAGGGLSGRQALRSVEAWKVGVTWLLFNAAALSFVTWAPKVFQDFKGMSQVQASLFASTQMLAAIPFVPVFGLISDRIGRRKPLMVIGSALMIGAFMAIAGASGVSLMISVAALGAVAALVPPNVMALPSEILGPALAGTGFGIVTICQNMGGALAPPFIGFLIDAYGSPTLSFVGMSVFSAMAAGVAYTLRTK